jgi:hypothetical protein
MQRRRKGKPYDPNAANRQSTDLLRNAMVAPVLVNDPYDPSAQIVVTRSLRDDPLGRMHVREQIDDVQYQGGRSFQRDFELAGRGPQAVDTTREPVDGGRGVVEIPEDQYKAARRLKNIFQALGLDGSALTRRVLVDGQTCAQIARARGLKGERWERYFGHRFRECLDRLAVEYGFMTEGQRHRA